MNSNEVCFFSGQIPLIAETMSIENSLKGEIRVEGLERELERLIFNFDQILKSLSLNFHDSFVSNIFITKALAPFLPALSFFFHSFFDLQNSKKKKKISLVEKKFSLQNFESYFNGAWQEQSASTLINFYVVEDLPKSALIEMNLVSSSSQRSLFLFSNSAFFHFPALFFYSPQKDKFKSPPSFEKDFQSFSKFSFYKNLISKFSFLHFPLIHYQKPIDHSINFHLSLVSSLHKSHFAPFSKFSSFIHFLSKNFTEKEIHIDNQEEEEEDDEEEDEREDCSQMSSIFGNAFIEFGEQKIENIKEEKLISILNSFREFLEESLQKYLFFPGKLKWITNEEKREDFSYLHLFHSFPQPSLLLHSIQNAHLLPPNSFSFIRVSEIIHPLQHSTPSSPLSIQFAIQF